MDCYSIATKIVGFVVSVFVGDLVIHPVQQYLWNLLHVHYEVKPRPIGRNLARYVGLVERALYTGAVLIGAYQWFGVWLAVKVAARWRSKAGGDDVPFDNVWLLLNALSLIFGFLGGCIGLRHFPAWK